MREYGDTGNDSETRMLAADTARMFEELVRIFELQLARLKNQLDKVESSHAAAASVRKEWHDEAYHNREAMRSLERKVSAALNRLKPKRRRRKRP